MKFKNILFVLLATFALGSCSIHGDGSNSNDGDVTTISVTGVKLNYPNLKLEVGATTQLFATVSPTNASDKSVKWTTNDESVATVSVSGLVSAISEGFATITVTTVDGNKKASCSVEVTPEGETSEEVSVTGISLNYTSYNLKVNNTVQLLASVIPNNATNQNVTWSSSNNNVATVNNGLVTGKSEGNATITVKTEDGNKTATCTITVEANASGTIDVSGVSLNKTSLSLSEGESETLTATVSPSNATNKTVNWTSANTSIATVNNGVVTGVSKGETTITATTADGGYKATCSIIVKAKESEEQTDTRMQDTAILHCWNWSLTNIQSRLSEIADAGYKTIQLSPMQPQKDYYSGQTWPSQWWKLYQPTGFSVAQSGQNVLGTKSQLATLCAKAEEYGIDVIVDVVSNHLGSGSNWSTFDNAIKTNEPLIYNGNLMHTLESYTDDSSIQKTVQGHLGGYPDLKTEDTTVQNRVISLLKEYIDCGVDGFRFDAAKHIETPDDGTYASNFWPNVLGTVTSYATAKGLEEPYYYGEILGTCGTGREFSSYTKYMSVVDSRQGSTILRGVTSGVPAYATLETYNTGVNPDHLVLWAESHDTYANDSKETTDIKTTLINKAYMIQASRKDASVLYFARPNGTSTKFGDVGLTEYKNAEIKAANLFHNTLVGKSENISESSDCFVNERGTYGAAIVAVGTSSNSVTISFSHIADGTYTDLVTNKSYTVSNGQATVQLTNGACFLIGKDSGAATSAPTISLGSYNEIYSGSQNITVTTTNASNVFYTINGDTENTLSSSTITLPSSLSNGKVVLKITATNSSGRSVSKTITLVKTDTLLDKSLIITDVSDASTYSYLCWSWSSNSDGAWSAFTVENNLIGITLSKNSFIVVKFPKGTTASNANWNNKISQTEDMTLDKKVYTYSELIWKNS